MTEVTAGITELSSHPSVEGASKTAPSPEANKDTLARQRAKEAQKKGVDLIDKEKKSGFFDASDKADARKDADRVLEQSEKHILDSDGLRSFFEAMSSVGVEATEIEKAASENMRIKVGDKMLKLDEWRAQREALRNPAEVGPQPDPELENGVFAYQFPEDESTKTQNAEKAETKIKYPKDMLLRERLLHILSHRKARVENGEQPGKVEEQERVAFYFASEAQGELSPLLQLEAYEMLKTHGDTSVEPIIQELRGKLPSAEKVTATLVAAGFSQEISQEITKAIQEKGLLRVYLEGKYRSKKFDELIIGREVTDEELKQVVDPDRKKKIVDALKLLLMILIAGPVAFEEKTVEPPRQ